MMAADPPGSRQAAEGLVLICEDWLRRRLWDGEPVLGPAVRAGLELAAAGAPRLAACCPGADAGGRAVSRLPGESPGHRPAASEEAQAAAGQARWLTTAQAAAVLGITDNGVRDLLRRGQALCLDTAPAGQRG